MCNGALARFTVIVRAVAHCCQNFGHPCLREWHFAICFKCQKGFKIFLDLNNSSDLLESLQIWLWEIETWMKFIWTTKTPTLSCVRDKFFQKSKVSGNYLPESWKISRWQIWFIPLSVIVWHAISIRWSSGFSFFVSKFGYLSFSACPPSHTLIPFHRQSTLPSISKIS